VLSKETAAMTTPSSIDPARFLYEHLQSASPDLPRSVMTTFVNTLMSAEVDAICDAPYGLSIPDRTNGAQRLPAARVRHPRRHPGRRDPQAAVRVVLPGLAARAPPARRGRADHGVATCYLLGVSTRRMEKLVETLGITRLSKSPVSMMAKELDGHVADFRSRPLDASPYTFVAADALVLKVREGGRVVNVHTLLATGVNADGHLEILGLQVSSAEDGAAGSASSAT